MSTSNPTPNPRPAADPDVYADNLRLRRQIEDLTAMITDLWFAGRDLVTVLTHRDPVSELEQQAVQRFHAALDRAARRVPAHPGRDAQVRVTTAEGIASAIEKELDRAKAAHYRAALIKAAGIARNYRAAPAESPAAGSAVPAEGSGHPQPSPGPWTGPRPTLSTEGDDRA